MQITPNVFCDGYCEETIAFYIEATDGELRFKMTLAICQMIRPLLMRGTHRANYADFFVSLSTSDEVQGKRWFDGVSVGGEIMKKWEVTSRVPGR